MAKIANQTAYPLVQPAVGDYFVITDVNDSNNTKTVSIGSLQGFMGSQPPAEITLTDVQLQDLVGNPVSLNVDNPSNDLIVPVSCSAYYTPSGLPFNFAPTDVIRIQPFTYLGTTVSYFEFNASLLNSVTPSIISPVNTWESTSQAFPLAIAGTDLSISASQISAVGGGKLKISVQYRLMSTT